MEYNSAYKKVKDYFKKAYRANIDELIITDCKGYWKDIKGYTYYYAEHGIRDKSGRFVSPYRVWEILYKYKRLK